MKDIKAIKGRFYIQHLIDQGEHQQQDFKYAINDAPKIAHSISAFANSQGGRLLVGVNDNGQIAGIRSDEDIYVVEQAALMYCDPPQTLQFEAFNVGQGVVVLCVTIEKSHQRPVYCREADGRLRAYLRVDDENIVAHPLLVRVWQIGAEHNESALVFSDVESQMLRLIREAGDTGIRPEHMPGAIHLSRALSDSAIVRLCSSGLAELAYFDGAFRLIIPS
ncbi:MAG: ATP-binding protein [Muribaculum sp.]|nr:ATP-binding protein [Muribaculaceae bacterium]MCM1081111.1 ATP-binding protein [Muribaculum sp.]